MEVRQPVRSLCIALLRPASILPLTANNISIVDSPPIGLAYLAASLKKAGHRVRIIDAFGEAPTQLTRDPEGYAINGLLADELVARIPLDVDLIGVTCMFSNSWLYYRRTIAEIAERFPHVPIVVGGEHPTADYERLLRRVPEVACCALGEGEETMVEIAERVACGEPFHDVAGLAVRDDQGGVRLNEPRKRIREVDEIPWPDWESVPLANYLDNQLTHDPFASRSMPILASRGCPYQCTFCSSPQMFGTRWVSRDPVDVCRELKHYHHTYGARYFEFQDLTMVINRQWIIDFCRQLQSEKLDIQWCMPSGTRSEALDAEVLGWMKRSGCRSFAYAAESGAPSELVRIKKKIKLPRLLASMREAVRLGLVTRCHLIFGMPGQTRREVVQTLGFVTRLALVGCHDLACYPFAPYPGSELYDRLVASGEIDTEAEDYDRVLAHNIFTDFASKRSWTPNIPGWALGWLCIATMGYFYALQFLLRPHRTLGLLRSLIEGRPRTYLQRMVLNRLRPAPVRAAVSEKWAELSQSA
ncbi:MAG TPA: cobalamin-dependent protein [Candidatus Binatia bacterium]|nr:cobalamin-dependent protein [Candidatus Binatia bacterium]